jgi:AcrR family transcriptional regulator
VQRRAERSREIVAATRALFDERGVREAQIEDIARAVGINRAIIYRHFSSKEELFAVTLLGYLAELDEALAPSDDTSLDATGRLDVLVRSFFDYGLEHPAFVDCAQTLLRRRGTELMEEVSEGVMIQLGTGMSACLGHVVKVLEAGVATGEFEVADPHLIANILYTQGLGSLNLAHLQISVREHNSGLPVVDPIAMDDLREHFLRGALAIARGR